MKQKNLVSQNSFPEIGYLREPQVLEIFPFSHSTLWRHVKDGRFPKPIKLSPRVTAWRAKDIQAHLNHLEG